MENETLITLEQCELMKLLAETKIENDEDYESLGKIFDDDFDYDEVKSIS